MLLTAAVATVAFLCSPRAAAAGPAPQDARLCGERCLVFCAHLLGKAATLDGVAEMTGPASEEHTSLAALQSAAHQLGLEARCYRMSLRDLAAMPQGLPAVAHVDGNHFVVVWRLGRGKVAVAEPPFGAEYVSLGQFALRWTGAIMLLTRPGEGAYLGDSLTPYLLAVAAAALGFVACERALERAGP